MDEKKLYKVHAEHSHGQTTAYADNLETAFLLATNPGQKQMDALVEEFNGYSGYLFALLKFVPEAKRDELEEELDDELSCFVFKETNKEKTAKLLETHVQDRDAFRQALNKI
jgi:hypothetical protein